MSEDRTAERPHYLCAAYSCPLLGVMTESTRGGDDWLCFCHFGIEAGERDPITYELHRMEWLCSAITDLRTHRGAGRRQVHERILHDLAQNPQLKAEYLTYGFVAFERAIAAGLQDACVGRFRKTQTQAEILPGVA